MPKARDRTGETHGTFRIVGRAPTPRATSYQCAFWLLRCACGNERVQSSIYLNEVRRKSMQFPCVCPEGRRRWKGMASLVGKRYGSLEVIEQDRSYGRGRYWVCRCDCGHTAIVPTKNLNSGNSRSCCGRRQR